MALILSTGTAIADSRCAAVANGGAVSLVQDGGQSFCVHQFSTAGTSTFNLLSTRAVQHLIVGGGGGAGTGGGGGGGAGTSGFESNGGAGRSSTITGSTVTYASGGNASSGNQSLTGGGGFELQAGRAGTVILRYLINTGPTANAGPDTVAFAGLQVTLDGSGTFDPDDNIVSYAWVQTSGPPVVLSGASSPTPSFTPAQPKIGTQETLEFELIVTDDFGLSSSDTVTIIVQGVAELTATKTATVFSEDGSHCANLSESAPSEPQNPAAIPGACIAYLVSVENTGPVSAQGINLIDALPASLTLRGAALTSGWEDGTTLNFTPDCTGADCTVEITGGVINADTTATLTIRATIN